jgi:hypothetical protein
MPGITETLKGVMTLNEISVASEVQCVSDSTDRQIDALVYELRPEEVPGAKGIRVDEGGD